MQYTGKIYKWFKTNIETKQGGYGFIMGSHNKEKETLFFHISNWESLTPPEGDQKVSYTVAEGKKGPEGMKVKVSDG
jgi:cold shock CspA family protein